VTSWDGEITWEIEIGFSEDFLTIVSATKIKTKIEDKGDGLTED
jgi:hypothetical protein